MSTTTKIEWTDATWSPITGCSVLSAGCTHCYAMRIAGGRLRNHPSRAGLTRESGGRQVWTGEVRLNKQWLDEPLRWRRPRRVFVCAHSDLFHENVPDEWIDQVFAVMALAPWHTFQVLTKRPERMRAYIDDPATEDRLRSAANERFRALPDNLAQRIEPAVDAAGAPWPLPHLWLGVSAEDQATADERIPILLGTPAALRWLSAEPLLGPMSLTTIDFTVYLRQFCADAGTHEYDPEVRLDALRGELHGPGDTGLPRLDWVVAGGESGPRARPSSPHWFRDIRDQCARAWVPFHFKQWGEFRPLRLGDKLTEEDIASGRIPALRVGINGAAHTLAGPKPMFSTLMLRLGKKIAGRTLDGTVHDEFPEGMSPR